jgi:hypothetical protein
VRKTARPRPLAHTPPHPRAFATMFDRPRFLR